jgi:predicted ester cyclase
MSNGSVNSLVCSPEQVKENIEKWIRIFPDVKVSVITLISDREYVSAYYKVQGRHVGEWKNIQPTNKVVEVQMMSMYKVHSGKICEEWINTNAADEVLKQITSQDQQLYLNGN